MPMADLMTPGEDGPRLGDADVEGDVGGAGEFPVGLYGLQDIGRLERHL